MSDCFPHFYCDSCSNVILRESDKEKVYYGGNEVILSHLEKSLPYCECGGKFKAGTNPKCPICKSEFKHQDNPVKRLTDPHMIIINGAVLFDENGKSYQIVIE